MKGMRQTLYAIGGILLFVGAAVMITCWPWAPYLYLVGAVLFGIAQVTDKYTGDSFVIRRLRRQQLIGAFLLVLAGVLMLTLRHNEWVVCLLVAAIIELYTSFRIPQEAKKD